MTPRKTEAYLNANAQFATPSGISQHFWTAVHEPILYITCVRFMTSPKGNSLSKPEKEAFAYFLCHYNITEAAVLGEELQKVSSNLLDHGKWQQFVSAILIYAMILTLAIILDLAIILRPVTTNTPISLGLLYFRLFKCISPFKPSEYRHGAGEVPSVSFHVIICTSPWEHTVNINENLEFKRSCYKYIQNAKAKRFCTFHHI